VLAAQDYKIIKYADSENTILVGVSPRSAYQDDNFKEWFNSEYTNYKLDIELLFAHKEKFEQKLIKIVLGTWCSDSRREVPRFVKMLDFINFPDDKIFFMNVDKSKKGIENEVDELDIEFVPTFIIYEDGEEIGRIVETPIETLEKDFINIVNK
jgi:thiol-disulfide isomerase/thioredoxin